jgi:hypothetical protein
VTFSQTIFSFSPEIFRFPSAAYHIKFLEYGLCLNSLSLRA